MNKRLRHSRWRRIPGLYRIGQKKPPDPNEEPQRLTLYLPWSSLDRAEALAMRAGVETIQQYCEILLTQAIDAEHDREQEATAEAKRVPLESFDLLASDPEYLAEWSALVATRDRSAGDQGEGGEAMGATDSRPADDRLGQTGDVPSSPPGEAVRAVEVVLRHAGLVEGDPSAFLPTLRRGESLDAGAVQELLGALRELEVLYRGARSLDRRVAYALHRLAFEGQVLLTDAWPAAPVEAATVDVLRIVQEAVDRVLSGEDIRYFAPGAGPEAGR